MGRQLRPQLVHLLRAEEVAVENVPDGLVQHLATLVAQMTNHDGSILRTCLLQHLEEGQQNLTLVFPSSCRRLHPVMLLGHTHTRSLLQLLDVCSLGGTYSSP